MKLLPPGTLTIYSIPIQNAQIESNFYLNLRPFFSVIQPVMEYRVTNNCVSRPSEVFIGTWTFDSSYVVDGTCLMNIPLNQSCVIQLHIDKITPPFNGPLISASYGFFFDEGYWDFPLPGESFPEAVGYMPGPTQTQVTPISQDGLHYNPSTYSIEGKPTRAGVYLFTINASNNKTIAEPRQLQINVSIDPKDTPRFKSTYPIADATPDKDYHLDLMTLIEPLKGFMVNNQIHFRIDSSQTHPSWLTIDKVNPTHLNGHVPGSEAGKTVEVSLIASSNTGGDSSPFTIRIPVAYDPAMKPVIQGGNTINTSAGGYFQRDLRSMITDPAEDLSLKVVIDKIEPLALWLSVSSLNPTVLNGTIPFEASGQTYQVSLHASTATGGSSDMITIPLKIDVNSRYTPQFYSGHPYIPYLSSEQSLEYDFVAHKDVHPDYPDAPFIVELAEGQPNPSWVRIENNKLLIDRVPVNAKQIEHILITIKNLPGGKSEVKSISLYIR